MCAIACPNLPPKFLNKQKLVRCKLKLLGMHLGLCVCVGGGRVGVLNRRECFDDVTVKLVVDSVLPKAFCQPRRCVCPCEVTAQNMRAIQIMKNYSILYTICFAIGAILLSQLKTI